MTLDETFLPAAAMAPPPLPDRVRIGSFQPRSFVAGPGMRAVLWVSGCLRRCPHCIKPDLLDFQAGVAVSIEQLASRIRAIPGLEGVTYSGGEPFEQALPLARLSAILRASGLSILVYSGYRLDALQCETKFRPLLDATDILIDGEFRQELLGPLRWRGSHNQKIHILSNRGQIAPPGSDGVCEVQASFTADALRLTGFPSDDFQRALIARLGARGIVMKPADLGDTGL